jgi:hypothetical protein
MGEPRPRDGTAHHSGLRPAKPPCCHASPLENRDRSRQAAQTSTKSSYSRCPLGQSCQPALPAFQSGCGSDLCRPPGQNCVGGNDRGGARTAGLEWTGSGAGRGALGNRRRRKLPRTSPAATRTSGGGSRAPAYPAEQERENTSVARRTPTERSDRHGGRTRHQNTPTGRGNLRSGAVVHAATTSSNSRASSS